MYEITSFWCHYCYLATYFTHRSGVSMVAFRQINAGWVGQNSTRIGLQCEITTIKSICLEKGVGKYIR